MTTESEAITRLSQKLAIGRQPIYLEGVGARRPELIRPLAGALSNASYAAAAHTASIWKGSVGKDAGALHGYCLAMMERCARSGAQAGPDLSAALLQKYMEGPVFKLLSPTANIRVLGLFASLNPADSAIANTAGNKRIHMVDAARMRIREVVETGLQSELCTFEESVAL